MIGNVTTAVSNTRICIYYLAVTGAAYFVVPSSWLEISPRKFLIKVFFTIGMFFLLGGASAAGLTVRYGGDPIIPNDCNNDAVLAAAPVSTSSTGPAIAASSNLYAPPPYTNLTPSGFSQTLMHGFNPIKAYDCRTLERAASEVVAYYVASERHYLW